jgi:hypothetical protein
MREGDELLVHQARVQQVGKDPRAALAEQVAHAEVGVEHAGEAGQIHRVLAQVQHSHVRGQAATGEVAQARRAARRGGDDDRQFGIGPARGVEIQRSVQRQEDHARLGTVALGAAALLEACGALGEDECRRPRVIRLGGQGGIAHHDRVGPHAQQRHDPAVMRVEDADRAAARVGRMVVRDAAVARGDEVGEDVGAAFHGRAMPVAGIDGAQVRGERRRVGRLIGKEQLNKSL